MFQPQWKTLTEAYKELKIPQPSLKMIRAAYHNAADLKEVAEKLCPKLGMEQDSRTVRYYIEVIKRAKKHLRDLPELPERKKKERVREDMGDLIAALQGLV